MRTYPERVTNPDVRADDGSSELNIFIKAKKPVDKDEAARIAERIAICAGHMGHEARAVQVPEQKRYDVFSNETRIGYIRYQ